MLDETPLDVLNAEVECLKLMIQERDLKNERAVFERGSGEPWFDWGGPTWGVW